MKTREEFVDEVAAYIEHPLKADQEKALQEVYTFLFNGGANSSFILRGYAGTGKTTLMGGLIRWFHSVNRKTVLLAPTGRSAKVLAEHSGFPASTIHRRIYAVKDDGFGRMAMQLGLNKSEKTIFIVDEASMIGEMNPSDGMYSRSLIEDLISYVQSGTRCRLIFVGDSAQLPPIGLEMSPALLKKRLASFTRASVFEAELTEVVRQASESLILENATKIRQLIARSAFNEFGIAVDRYRDVSEVDNYDLEDLLSSFYQSESSNESIIICRSNKNANAFNFQIRGRILDREETIEAGDRLMIVKNNYFWKLPGKRQNFLANGDMIYVERVNARYEFDPFRFAEVEVSFLGEEGQSFSLILLLNTLDHEGANIGSREIKKMREALIDADVIDANDPEEKFFQNPYFHAVQVKYAYAVTCHKSQGGQWENVLIYHGYFTDEMMDKSYLRWMYTAVTRASEKLYLVGFPPQFLISN